MSESKQTMRAIQVSAPNGPFETVERPIPQPAHNQVLIKVEACGMCHSDSLTKTGHYPAVTYPRVPGHEVVGRVVQVGAHVPRAFKPNQLVGVGWHGGHCFGCNPCQKKAYVCCSSHRITGINLDGGYAEYVLAAWESVAEVPEGLDAAEAAPLLCAGVTVYNGMRNAGILPGEVVAIQGVGGLGHLGIQYARAMGFQVVAISTSQDKKELATQLGAHIYLDSSSQNVVAELNKLGGAKCIVCTAFNSDSMTPLIDGLGLDGVLLVVGADAKAIQVSPFQLIGLRRRVMGWASGSATDSEDALRFAQLHNIRSYVERMPFSQVNEAYEKMMANRARFRMVLTPQ